MYLTKEKKKTSLYKEYSPKYPNHQEVELQSYVANIISYDLSQKMKSTVGCMSSMIVHGFTREDDR